jgi:hypothetical protein
VVQDVQVIEEAPAPAPDATEAERERCRTDLLYFARKYLGYTDLDDKVHGDMVRRLGEYLDDCQKWSAELTLGDKIKGLLKKESRYPTPIVFLIPRGFLKTSLLSIAWAIQRILKNPNITIRILSYGWGRAVEILTEIKDHLMNPQLVTLFPEILWESPKRQSPKWGEDAITVKRTKVVAGYTIKVDSIMGGITGSHCDVMLFDDLHDIENTGTAEQIAKVIQRFRNCRSVLKPKGLRIIVGTVWTKDDFYSWCAEQAFPIYRRVATYNSKGEECDCDDPDAQSYFPAMFDIEELRQIKRELGRAFYACQYNLMALADEDLKFTEDMIHYYEGEVPYSRVWILVDPALGRTKNADESVTCVVGKPRDTKLKLRVLKSKGQKGVKTQKFVSEVIDEAVFHLKAGSEVTLGIESAAMQYVLNEWVDKELRERQVPLRPIELKHGSRPKPERISKLLPLFENEMIELHHQRCEKLVRELLDYGAISSDNHPDALAYLVDVLDYEVDVEVLDLRARSGELDEQSFEDEIAALVGGEVSWKDF